MKRRYIILFALMMMISLVVLTGCEKEDDLKTTSTSKTNTTTTANTESKTNTTETETVEFDYKAAAEKQMAMPEVGETIAIIKIKNHGEVKVKFFDKIAPKAVENFTTHAKNGYYDGLTFHRVINEFMIQGGDPTGTGTGGESIWGAGFPEELAYELVPYRGSLCMASAGVGTSSLGSQFFITQAHYKDDEGAYFSKVGLPESLRKQYEVYGGNILSLYCSYTVFGRVYEGMDIVDKIAAVETGSVPMVINGVTYGTQADKPVKDVVIESIEVTVQK